MSISICYGTQSDILLRASLQNFERLDILRDTIGHSSKKLLLFEFAQSLCFQFRASRYIRALNRTSELKFIGVWICYELLFPITSVSIYYGTQSDIRDISYFFLHLLRAYVFNSEHLDILRDTIVHPSKKLLLLEFAKSLCFQFRVSQYITGHNRTSE